MLFFGFAPKHLLTSFTALTVLHIGTVGLHCPLNLHQPCVQRDGLVELVYLKCFETVGLEWHYIVL